MKTERKIFSNDTDDANFKEHGYVLHQFLSEDDIKALLKIFDTVKPPASKNFYSSIDIEDTDYRMEVDRQINELIGDRIKAMFVDYNPLIFNFIVKLPGADTEVMMHVDDSHVDESKYQSVNIWIPLVDTNEQNGMLYVLPGSQRFPYPVRGINLPYPYNRYTELIKPYMMPLKQKAGEAIFYNNMLMHRSDANMSDSVRPAVITGMMPAEAQPMIHVSYDGLPPDKAEQFKLDKTFYLKLERGKRPDFAESLGIVPFAPIQMEEAEFLRMVESLNPKKKGFFEKIMSAFS